MSNRESEGPIQIWGNSPHEINDALAQIGNRLDHLKGLRGRTEVWDRIRANDPSQTNDVLTKGSLSTIAQIVFVTHPCPLLVRKPGVSNLEVSGVRKRYNFSAGQATAARLVISAWGTEAGTKTVGVTMTDASGILCTVSWTSAAEGMYVGEVGSISVSVDTDLKLYTALSTTEESLVLNWVMLELSG